MYAVIQTGENSSLEGDYLARIREDCRRGAEMELDKVLMIADGDNIKVGLHLCVEGWQGFSHRQIPWQGKSQHC